jgi:hypothetical protein
MDEVTRLAREAAPQCFRVLDEIATKASASARDRTKANKELKRRRPLIAKLATAPDTSAEDREYLTELLERTSGSA